MNTSVVSAAIIEGNLIIGLSDGSVINCGFVQGPQGLTGPEGPMGSPGDRGTDGNTIHTIAGTPGNEIGSDGDYAIDNINWRIYGPKSGGTWGKAKELLPGPENLIVNGRGFEGGAGGSGDTGGGGGGGGIQLINGGDGITTTAISSSLTEVDADIATEKGLQFDAGRIAINLGTGLEFDATTGALKSAVNAAEYAKITYVDTKTAPLPYRIETDKVLRDGKASTLSTTAEIQLVDNDDNFTNVKFTGLNGIGVTSDQQGITFDGAALLGDITVELDDYATKQYSDAQDQNLQNQIDDLSVSKGQVARYEVKNTIGTPVSRPGELSVNTPFYVNTSMVSFGIEDLDGNLTKPMQVGDIMEFIDEVSSKVSRYRILDAAGAPTAVGVEYISGDNDFAMTEVEQVYIYPQNEAGASKEYVDAQDDLRLVKSGDEMTGLLTVKPTSGNYGLVVQPGPDASGTTDIFRVRDYANNQVFYADVSGGVGVGNSWTPTSNNHLIPKKYLEEYVDTHGGGDAKVPVQSGAPSGITVGSMWFDTSTNSLMIKVS